MTDPRSSAGKHPPEYPRSLPASEWPDADRRAWEDVCRSGSRLKLGGAASYLAEVSRNDYANRYGHSWASCSGVDGSIAMPARPHRSRWQMLRATSQTSTARVRSGTVWNCIYKLRRAAELLAPKADFSWLAEIEKDLALVIEPRSKYDRLVFTGPLAG